MRYVRKSAVALRVDFIFVELYWSLKRSLTFAASKYFCVFQLVQLILHMRWKTVESTSTRSEEITSNHFNSFCSTDRLNLSSLVITSACLISPSERWKFNKFMGENEMIIKMRKTSRQNNLSAYFIFLCFLNRKFSSRSMHVVSTPFLLAVNLIWQGEWRKANYQWEQLFLVGTKP